MNMIQNKFPLHKFRYDISLVNIIFDNTLNNVQRNDIDIPL